ncbi:tripartite tricarboxylate transporter TctB family protein [Blastococcus sp. VKM Ac-2987]|uniref:tripartite tricarboxylate transporter TctB family protein n=1 Tax=Blastococcus sp. VKM Ac-2987 TaxID=3004141 RepID=UPI0022AB98F0|nr:tripartite tricarboxylate transporter TctB family protein [Blastococcus sp. VKM Ac-2987]MCZ2857782.1 tripartite tricarboxylate transporter TctB family protein [Blastococcus sp. VKM Ac-2987]
MPASTEVQRQHRYVRLGFAFLLSCWAVSVIVEATSMPTSAATPADVGPGFMPLVLGLLLLGMALAEIALALVRRPVADAGAGDGSSPTNTKQLLYLVAVVISAVITYAIGVLAAVAALVLWSMKVVEERTWARSLLVTAVLVTLLYLLFDTLLNVRIPLLPS